MKLSFFSVGTVVACVLVCSLNLNSHGADNTPNLLLNDAYLLREYKSGEHACSQQILNYKGAYDNKLQELLRYHYLFTRENTGNFKLYVDIYEKLLQKPNLSDLQKLAYITRLSHGYIKLKEPSKANMKIANAEKIKSAEIPPYEAVYLETVKAFSEDELEKRSKLLSKALKEWQKLRVFPWELNLVTNNYAVTAEIQKNYELAMKLYLNAAEAAIEAKNLPDIKRNLFNLTYIIQAKPSLSNDIFAAIAQLLKKYNNAEEAKAYLLVSVIYSSLYRDDTRKLRQYTDELASCVAKLKDEKIKAIALCRIGIAENILNNPIDSIASYSKAASLLKDLNAYYMYFLTQDELLNLYIKLGKKDKVKKILDFAIKNPHLDDHLYLKASILANGAIYYLQENDLANYKNKVQEALKCNEAKAAQILADNIFILIRDNKNIKQNRSLILKLSRSIPPSGVDKVSPPDLRDTISLFLSTMNISDEAAKWANKKDLNGFQAIILAEKYIANGRHQEAIKILNSIKIEPMLFGTEEMTKEEVELIVLADKLAVYVNTANINDGLKTAKKLEKLVEKTPPSKGMEGIIAMNIGTTYVLVGDVVKGKIFLNAALPYFNDIPIYRAMCLLNLGMCALHLGDSLSGVELFGKAAIDFQALGNIFLEGRCRVNLALALFINEDYAKAEKEVDKGKALAQKANSTIDINRAIFIKAAIISQNPNLSRSNKLEKFKELYEECKLKMQTPSVLKTFYLFSAQFYNENNLPLETVIYNLEQYFKYHSLTTGNGAIQLKGIFVDNYDDAKELLLKSLAENSGTKKLDYWLKYFEKSNLRAQEKTAVKEAMSTDVVENKKIAVALVDIVERLENIQQIIAIEEAKPEKDRDKNLLQQATHQKRELNTIFESAKKRVSKKEQAKLDEILSDNFVINPDSFDQLIAVLPKDTACLQIIPLENAVYIYVAGPKIPPFIESIKYKDYNTSKKKLFGLIAKSRALIKINKDKTSKKLLDNLEEINNLLFKPIEKALQKAKVKRLLVNSTGQLRYLPFVTLFDGKQFLVEKFQVTNVTGLDLIRLARLKKAPELSKANIVIFADPDGTLPKARIEGKDIASLIASSKIYVGDKASLKEFEAMVGDVNFVHLATHAVLDPNKPQNSYILFADGKQWKYSDMMGFNITNVDSFVLSACTTAMSEKSYGGEIEGMAYQLLKKSPSGSVVASFWKVDDESTSTFMNEYYKNIVNSLETKKELDRGGALRKSQLKLLKDKKTSAPFHWSAFTLFGDFR